MKKQGIIKKYVDNKGYGFIYCKELEDNVFFHISDVQGQDRKAIAEQVWVSFTLGQNEKGLVAKGIRLLKNTENDSNQHPTNQEITSRATISGYQLPSDTREVIGDAKLKINNFSLDLNKAIDFKNNDVQLPSISLDHRTYNPLIQHLQQRQQRWLKQWGGSVKSFVFQNDWRIALGIGQPSVYETSLTLHYIYGIPYIPAQSIKGMLRSYIILELFGRNQKGEFDPKNAEKRALQDQTFCDIFGCPPNSYYQKAHQGNILFFDAFPVETPQIEKDIMNPHYGPYYADQQGKTAPGDYYDPLPIFFLTVKEGKYRFYVGAKMKDTVTSANACWIEGLSDGVPNVTLLDIVYHWLKRAVVEFGIGAKTSVGYGYGKVALADG